MPSQESIFTFAPRRLAELRKDIAGAKDRLSRMEHELKLLEALVKDLPPTAVGAIASTTPAGSPAAIIPSAEAPNAVTIKQKAMHVLRAHGAGMSNSQILLAINQTFGVDLPQRTLSPQLGRLSDSGDIRKQDDLWHLTSQIDDKKG